MSDTNRFDYDRFLVMIDGLCKMDIATDIEIFRIIRKFNRNPVNVESDAAIIREEVQRIVFRKEIAYRAFKHKYPWYAYVEIGRSEYEKALNMIYICLNNYPRDELKKLKMLVGNKF